jgi:catechol-2,3-dioxygenase
LPRLLREEVVVGSPKLAHLILNTGNYDAMKQWYLCVLDATIGIETAGESGCFLRIDESHHRIGMFKVANADDSDAHAMPGSADVVSKSRLNHFSFEYPTLEDLFDTHERVAKESIYPTECMNHGPTMSMYYQDPDHNVIELFFDNKYSEEQIVEWYGGGDSYVRSATPFDPAEKLQELRDGKTVAEVTAWAPPHQR